MTRTGVYPGSFDPPTVAHLAIADAARRQRRLDRLDLVVSRITLAKEHLGRSRLDHRVEVLEQVAARLPWLGVRVTEDQLLADIAEGYDVLVMGADKWTQINEVRWYRDDTAMAAALARLPEVAVVPRHPHPIPDALRLDVPEELVAAVSSTAVRAGHHHLMLPEARAFAEATGAWIDDTRYRSWLHHHHPNRRL